MSIRISVVICTLDRPELLRKAVRSLLDQTADPARYEILVVDNGPDQAAPRSGIAEFDAVRNFRRVAEPVQGLSRARNTGWRMATGDLVAYLDDDATAEPEWVDTLLRRFESKDVAAVGGPVHLVWERDPAGWLPMKYWPSLAHFDAGPDAKPLRFPEHPYGANMAFRKTALQAVGGFPEFLGRHGTRMLSNEEEAVFWMIERKQLAIWYEPRAAVAHFVPASRMTAEYMIRSWRGQAASDAIFQARIQRRRTGYLTYRLLKSISGIVVIDAPCAVLASHPIRALEARLFNAYRRAYILELFRIIVGSTHHMARLPESDSHA